MANRQLHFKLHLYEILGFIIWEFTCEVFSTLSSSTM